MAHSPRAASRPGVRRLFGAAVALFAAGSASAQSTIAEHQQRRDQLIAQLPESAIVIALGAHEPAQDYLAFYQSPSFNYLTGFLEPDAALVIIKTAHGSATTLFVEPAMPMREVWVGARLGVSGAMRRTGVAARENSDFPKVLDSLASTGRPFYFIGDFPGGEDGGVLTADQQLVAALRKAHANLAVKNGNPFVEQLRGRKSAGELAAIRQAAEITARAERDAMLALQPGMNEFEIQALIEYDFRRNGADRPSFASIVGSGPNATTLHYNLDDRRIQRGELVVMDVGASYKGYAADVTRTIPSTGVYSPEQRAIYQLVRDAQAAAERQAKLGAPAHLMSDSATAVLARGLARLGLIDSPTASYDCDIGGRIGRCAQLELYYMHGLGHGLGLEVHDPDQYYFTETIAPGSAFTIEPGIYVRSNVLDALPQTPRNREMATRLGASVERYRNIGVRVEDDYIATDTGIEWVSRAPRELTEIEALMKPPRASWPAPRDSALVERYGAPR